MPVSADLITDQVWADHLSDGLNGSEVVSYYIHDVPAQNLSVGSQGGNATVLAHHSYQENYIVSVFDSIDPTIDLDFKRVYTDDESNLDIYQISSHTAWEASWQGLASPMGSGSFDIGWKATDSWQYNRNTIIHEIGHTLGLDHPGPAYTDDDTVMSYKRGLNGWAVEWTQSDINALVSLWGREDDEPTEIIGTNLSDKLIGDSRANVVRGGYGDDSIGTLAGDDYVYGNQGADSMSGGSGGDFVYGGQDDDWLYGNQGSDYLYGNLGADLLYGGQDADVLYGGQDDDTLYGNKGSDYLYGNLGADLLYGGQGDDVVYGNKGNDTLYGNEGNDTLYGNEGADIFVATKGFDLVKDFWTLDGDRISVAAGSGVDISEQDGSTLITSGEGQLLIEGFASKYFDESQHLIYG